MKSLYVTARFPRREVVLGIAFITIFFQALMSSILDFFSHDEEIFLPHPQENFSL